MLKVDRLTLQRGGQRFCFDFTLPPAARLAISGASGAGKSTLLDLIAGFERPDAGELSWQGQSLLPLVPAERPVNLLFQQDNLFEHLSVAANVRLGLTTRLWARPGEAAQVAAVLDAVGLTGLGRANPSALSGGQRQRVALARCLLRDRPLLLLDEPFSALDPERRGQLLDLLDDLTHARGWTVLLVSHDLSSLAGFASHHLRVTDGVGDQLTPFAAALQR